jgi:hypothetical protein
MSKLLSVGLMVGAIGFSIQTANAGRWHHWYGGCTCPSAPVATAWQGAATAQPMAAQASPAPAAGQTAQSNGQTYQSFSAEPAPAAPSGPTAAPYAAGTVNGGGYYGGPTYGGPVYTSPGNLNSSQNNPAGNLWTSPVAPSYYGSQGSLDTANNHGIPGPMNGLGGGGGSTTVGGTAGAPY